MDDGEHISIASLAPDVFCVTFSGLSKSHMIAGFRVGWMILSGNKDVAKDYIEGINMLSNMRLCSNVPAQSIVQTALGGYQSVKNYIIPGGRIYEQREFMYKAINDIPGLSVVKPKAAFYAFPKIDVRSSTSPTTRNLLTTSSRRRRCFWFTAEALTGSSRTISELCTCRVLRCLMRHSESLASS